MNKRWSQNSQVIGVVEQLKGGASVCVEVAAVGLSVHDEHQDADNQGKPCREILNACKAHAVPSEKC